MVRTLQICLCALISLSCWSLQGQTLQEDALKAGYLVNFFEFVEWDQLPGRGHRIGVLDAEGLAAKIEAIGLTRLCNHEGMVVSAVNFETVTDIDNVDLLFVPRGKRMHWRQLVEFSELHNCLLVGEESGFLEMGGGIQFVTINNRLRFKINNKQAEKLGIRMSSKLLNLAVEVRR